VKYFVFDHVPVNIQAVQECKQLNEFVVLCSDTNTLPQHPLT